MAQRKRLGIRFNFSYTTSTGAAIYFQNIIRSLDILPDERKPQVYVFVSPDAPIDDIRSINYPYMTISPIRYLPIWKRAINRIYRSLSKGKNFNLINARTYYSEPLDGVISLVIPSEDIATRKQLIWIADLQMYHLPYNFTKREIEINKALEERTVRGRHDIVLCSQWVIDDFNRIFKGHLCKTHRLRFATIHPEFSHIDFNTLQQKYVLNRPYFIVSNQFWVHKNHLAAFKAINQLKSVYPEILCAITGHPKIVSEKGKDYIQQLMDYFNKNELERHIRFLGLIPREEQLCLLKNSMAIIQPSFFESWNTTVEDAKLLRKHIILSDLEVHREQIHENVYFFDPNNVDELAHCMTVFLKHEQMSFIDTGNYQDNVREFADTIVKMLDE